MKMFSLIGVSGSGKGSIIQGLQKKMPSLKQISLTRILMQYFKIISTETVITKSHYLALESIPQAQKYDALNSHEFLELLQAESGKYDFCACEVHFVIPIRNADNTVTYFKQIPPVWFEQLNSFCIYLQNDIEEITSRKKQDALNGKRDRGSSTLTLESTQKQVSVSNEVWEEYKRKIQIPYLEIKNHSGKLQQTVDDIYSYLRKYLF